MAQIKPGVSLRAVQTALLLGMVTLAVLVLAFGCSGAQSPLPARDLGRALCALEVVEQLPPDPKRVAIQDVENVVREYRACLEAPDAGAR
jgi:hypothetical protein